MLKQAIEKYTKVMQACIDCAKPGSTWCCIGHMFEFSMLLQNVMHQINGVKEMHEKKEASDEFYETILNATTEMLEELHRDTLERQAQKGEVQVLAVIPFTKTTTSDLAN